MADGRWPAHSARVIGRKPLNRPPIIRKTISLTHTYIPPKLTSLTTYAHETKAPKGVKPQTIHFATLTSRKSTN